MFHPTVKPCLPCSKMGAIERGNTADRIANMLHKKYERVTERLCILELAKALVKQKEGIK